MKYARVLLGHCPADTTQLFIDYFTGHYRPKKKAVISQVATPQPGGYGSGAVNAVQNLRDLLPLPYMNTSSVASPPTQGNVVPTVSEQVIDLTDELPIIQYTPTQPRTAFSSIRHIPLLHIGQRYPRRNQSPPKIWPRGTTTLYRSTRILHF